MASVVGHDDWGDRKRTIAGADGSVAFIEFGGGEPALVLVHGFTDTCRSYSLLAPHLAGRRLLIPDLRGHGASKGAEADRLSDFACDVVALVEARRLCRPILVGHSLGGMVAVEACAARPELFGGLVTVASSLRPNLDDDHPIVAGVAALRDPIDQRDPFYAFWHQCRADVPAPFLELVAREASLMPARRWRSTLEIVRALDLRSRAEGLAGVETLIINGADDPLFGQEHREALISALSHAHRVDLAGCGHNPHWEEPGQVAQAILARFPALT